MPARDYAIYTGFRRGGAPEYQITGMRRGGGVEIPVAPAAPPLETAPIAQPPMVLPANAATFQTAAGWTIPTGVTVDTSGNGRAVVDGTGTTRNIDRTIPAMDTGKTYGVTVGFANKVAGRNQLSFLGGTTATLMGNGYLTGHRTARFTPASAHTSMRIGLFSESGNPQMDVIDAQIADITAMLANPRAIFIDAGQSNAAGAFARTGFDAELDKPELRCLAVPSRTTTTLNCVTDGTGASYGTALGTLNGIGTAQPMTTPLAHVTAVATDATVTPAVMPALAASRHMCDHWPYPGYTPTMILSGAAQASLFNAAHWDFEASPAGGYYRLMRAQIDAQLAAVPGSFVAGFFWQQGEADSGNLEYNAKFTRMIAELRAAYGDFPVIIREIGGLLTAGNTAAFIERQKRLASNSGHADALSRCSYVGRPVGIADNLLLEDEAGSWIHYRADTSRTMGEDGGEAMVAQLVRRPVPSVAAPVNTAAPVISGGAAEGDAYVHAGDTWTGSTPMTPSYLWELSVANGAWTQFSTAASPVRPAGHAGNRVRLTKTMTNSVTGTSVVSNILSIAAEAPSNLRAGTITDPGVGIYLNWNRFTEVHGSPFIDHLKLGDGWRSSGGGNLNWNQLLAAGHIDAEGRAISKPAGADNLLFPALAAMPAQSDGTRRYRLFYEGNITNGWVVGSADAQDTGTSNGLNYIDFDYTANGENSASLLLDSWTGIVRLRGLVRHDDLADFHAGHIFRRPWLEMIRNTRMLRFVDWMGTENYGGSGLWANRYTPGRATYQGGEGVPVEVMCQLCNLIGADPWFSLVSNADDNYVTQFATVARNTLGANRHMYLELSSKAWDGANYSTADYFRSMAVTLFSSASIEASMEAYGGRSSQVFMLARAVWSGADLPRLHTILQGWTPNADISEFAFSAPRWVALGGGRVAPWTVTTDYALHANLDGDMRYNGTSTRDPLDSLIAANGTNSPTVFNYMANAMSTGGGYSISGLETAYAAQKAMIANYGNPTVICYEGGSHLCVPPERNNNANWIATFNNYHNSQIWADVWQEDVENWYDAFGPANIFVFKSDIRLPDQNNGYGILRWSGDTVNNPRLTMFLNNVNTRVGDGSRGANDFVGTFDTTDGYAA